MSFDAALVTGGGNRDFKSFRQNSGDTLAPAGSHQPGDILEGGWVEWDDGRSASFITGVPLSFPQRGQNSDPHEPMTFRYGFDGRGVAPGEVADPPIEDRIKRCGGGVLTRRRAAYSLNGLERPGFPNMLISLDNTFPGEAHLLQTYGYNPYVRVWSGMDVAAGGQVPSVVIENCVVPMVELYVPEDLANNIAAFSRLEPITRGLNFTSDVQVNYARKLAVASMATVAVAMTTAARDYLPNVVASAFGPYAGICGAFLRVPA